MTHCRRDDVNRTVYGDQAAIKRLQFMAPLSDEERQTYSDLWDRGEDGVRAVTDASSGDTICATGAGPPVAHSLRR